jgi:hypothetical protein
MEETSRTTLCESRPIKRRRRTKADLENIKAALYDVVEADQPVTVRQAFYQLVSSGVIPKTETSYKNIVVRLLGIMRREGELPFSWIADNTRWMRKPQTYSSLERALGNTIRTYRRALWDEQDSYVEIWLEKDALAGVLYDVTAEWDVPLMVTRGYPSLSYLHTAAEALGEKDRPCFIYYFGDHDPIGVHIPRKIEADLRTFAPEAELHFKRVAVTLEQIERWNLPTRPTKRTDSRSKNFFGESVEVDAIPPAGLRNLCRRCIEQHIDRKALQRTRLIERAERDTLQTIMDTMQRNAT